MILKNNNFVIIKTIQELNEELGKHNINKN